MANRVTISSVGPTLLTGNHGTGQAAVDFVIEFWRDRLGQVLPDQPDLIVTPEACDRFIELSREELRAYYRTRGNQVRDAFADIARTHRCYIAYSAARELPDGTWRNSTQLIDRAGGVIGTYDKNHCTSPEIEGGTLCGSEAPVFECDFGRVACLICFDLNFDDLRRQYVAARPDLLIFSSMYHGGLMQSYWAYSCRAHMVTAICRQLPPSAILSPVGHVIASSTNYTDHVTATVNLDCKVAHLDFNEDKLKALKAKYGPGVTIFDPGQLGSVLLTSERDDVTSADMVHEFEIELLDDYLPRALAHQRENRDGQ